MTRFASLAVLITAIILLGREPNLPASSRSRRAPSLRSNGSGGITTSFSPTSSTIHPIFFRSSALVFNHTIPNPTLDTSANFTYTLTTPTGTTTLITTDVSCSYSSSIATCNWNVDARNTVANGYTITVLETSGSTGITSVFAISDRNYPVAATVRQSEIVTISENIPAGYNTVDVEVHSVSNDGSYAYDDSAVFSILSNSNDTSGSYVWTVPLNLANTTAGYTLYMWVSQTLSSTPVLLSVSEVFTVVPPSLSSLYPGQSMSVAFPSTGDMWRSNTNDSVSFNLNGGGSFTGFNVDAYAAGPSSPAYYKPIRLLTNADPTKRSFTFTVPTSLTLGNYFVYVWGFEQSGQTTGVPMGAQSGVFLTYGTIPPTASGSQLYVTRPTSSATWYKGATYQLQWSASFPISSYEIYLDYITNTSSAVVSHLATNLTGPAYSWSWTIPRSLASHRFYSIRVQGSQNAAQGGGVFTGIAYPLNILTNGESASSVDVGVSGDSTLGNVNGGNDGNLSGTSAGAVRGASALWGLIVTIVAGVLVMC